MFLLNLMAFEYDSIKIKIKYKEIFIIIFWEMSREAERWKRDEMENA